MNKYIIVTTLCSKEEIAKKFNITVEELKKLNNINEIYPGQIIKIEK